MVYSPTFSPSMLTREQTGLPDYAKALGEGLDIGNKPKVAAADLLAKALQAKMNLPYAENADEAFKTDMDYKRALMQQAQRGGNPLSNLMGPAREAYSIELLKNQLGENSPAYQNAKSQYDLTQQSQRGLNDYRQGLADTMLKRSSSNLGKLSQEEQDIQEGYEPNTNRQHQISPERQEELIGQYALTKQKVSTDTDTRKRNLLASNIEKTKDSIDTNDLTRYAGLNGAIKLKQEQAKALSNPGSESEDYRKYLEASNKAQFMAHQVRQFYGESIQPSVLRQIELLTNPGTWKNNPEIATRLYKSFTDLLGKEMSTYRGALQNKKEYQGSSGKTRVYYNGTPHMIPNEQVQAALRAGGNLNG